MAGILAGMFGVGGGIVIVPLLTFIFLSLGLNDSYVTHLAVGTSLFTIIFTGLSMARAHFIKMLLIFRFLSCSNRYINWLCCWDNL